MRYESIKSICYQHIVVINLKSILVEKYSYISKTFKISQLITFCIYVFRVEESAESKPNNIILYSSYKNAWYV